MPSINPHQVEVSDPAVMTRHIKAVAHDMGGADVGAVAKAHPAFLYAGGHYAQDGSAQEQEVIGDFGFYPPLKENTNRFVKR